MGLLRTIQGPAAFGVSSLRVHPTNESLLCATTLDDYASIYDVRTEGPAALVLKGHSGPINTCLFLDDGNYLATASDDRTVRVYDMRNPEAPAQMIRGYKEALNTIVRDPLNNSNIVCGADDGLVYVHQYELNDPAAVSPAAAQYAGKWKMIDNFMVSSGTVNDLVVLPGSTGLYVTASEEGCIRMWNRDVKADAQMEDRIVQSYDEFDQAVNHLHLTQRVAIPNVNVDYNTTSWIFFACAEHVFATTINHETGAFGEENLAFGCHTDYVRGVEAITDSVLLTVSDDCTAVMWETATGRPMTQAKLHEQMIMAMAVGYTNGGGTPSVLYTGSEDGSICMWSLPLEGETPAYDPTSVPHTFSRGSEWVADEDGGEVVDME